MRTRARALGALAASALAVVSCAALVDLQEVPYAERDASIDRVNKDGSSLDAAPDPGLDGGKVDGSTADAGACEVRADKKLHCTNRQNAPLHSLPMESAPVVNTLRTTSSYFECWAYSEKHAGGNTTWYFTLGDDNPMKGWTPGVMLNTPNAFDANPTAFGLRNCPP